MSYAATVLVDNPIAYYRLDETSAAALLVDSSGNSHNGILTSGGILHQVTGAVDTNAATEKFGSGTFQLGNDAAFQISTGTIEAWVKTMNPGTTYRCILEKETAYGLFIKDGVLIAFSWGAPGGDKSTGINIADGVYHHVALTFADGVSNGSAVYLDGRLVLATTIGIGGQGTGVSISAQTNGGQALTGTLDEVAIYGAILSPDRILAHFNAGNVSAPTMTLGILGTRRG